MTDLIEVLANPPRQRLIFERLAKRAQSVGEMAQGLPISRPAVSQHLAALKSTGLVSDHPIGTRRIYRINPNGLAAIRSWLDQFWTATRDTYAAEITQTDKVDANPPVGIGRFFGSSLRT